MSEAWEPLAFLVGTWRGEGEGEYPTIQPFRYAEEITFTGPPGKVFLAYTQRTWHPEKGFAMHTEAGYFRPVSPDRVEIVMALPTGQVEIEEGSIDGTTIDARSTTVRNTSTAKDVKALARRIGVDGDVLRYTLQMALGSQPLQPHLAAELRKVRP